MMPNPSFPCIFCDATTGTSCSPGCPSPTRFDPTPIENALGLHLEVDL